jgi:DNA-binding protein H-NS
MKKIDFEEMPLDDLWRLHEQISKVLSSRILAEKRQLERRLVLLNRGKNPELRELLGLKPSETDQERPRRKYPRVLPKYQNPAAPAETWSGRGKRPRWLVSALNAGGKIEDFQIPREVPAKISARR